jgi:2-dehydropantoate 2-reductase
MGTLSVRVVGAGAIGGTVAGRLVRSGEHVVVVDADRDHVARLRDPGIAIGDDDPVPLSAYTPDEADALERPCDVLLLAVRSELTETALAPFAADAGDVVSLQNGLNEETIAALVGEERTVGCVVGFGATYLGPGEVEITSDGGLSIGRLDGSSDQRLENIRDLLNATAPTTITPDIRAQLWTKMLVNSVTVLGAVGGMLTGEVLAPERRPVVHAILSEGTSVALAAGVELPDIFGIDPRLLADRGEGWREQLDPVLDAVAEHVGQVKSVTLRDFELGRRPEIDAVTGELVRRGGMHGVPTPANRAAQRVLMEIAAGVRLPDPANFDELTAAVP